MCDGDSFDDMVAYRLRREVLSRRGFGSLSLGAGIAQASLPANVEVFEGTMHGWCPPDSHVYKPDAAEKAWSELLTLFKSALG